MRERGMRRGRGAVGERGTGAFWDLPDGVEVEQPARAPRLAPGRRAAWRRSAWRRVSAGVLAVGAVLATVAATRPPPPVPGVDVVVAARDLAAGHVLSGADLTVAEWPVDVVPGGAGSGVVAESGVVAGSGADGGRALVGEVLAGPVGRGEPLTRQRVVGAGLLDGQPAGTAAAHVPLQGTGVAAMVRPGDRVDVVAGDGTVLAPAVVVLAVLGAGDGGSEGGTLGLDALAATTEPGVVVAVPQERVPALARAVDPTTGTAPTVVLSARR